MSYVIPGQNYLVDYHIQMNLIATFYLGTLNTRMQQSQDIQLTKSIKTLQNVGDQISV